MHPGINRKLRMEGCGDDVTLPDQDGILAFRSQHLHTGAESRYLRSPNENHLDGRSLEPTFADGAIDLAPISIAAHTDINRTETNLLRVFHFPGQKDRAGTGAERRFQTHELLQLFESGFAK